MRTSQHPAALRFLDLPNIRRPGWARRVRQAATAAKRAYCERLVRRALMIEPVRDRGEVDVHFCDVN